VSPWLAMIAGAAAAGIPLGLLLHAQRRSRRQLAAALEATHAELQRLQESCARLAPGNVVDRMIVDGALPAAERREVTALFADLIGYTALSERLEPAVLARVLNGYFQRMSDAITEHRGHVSTFIGDGILAFFGVPEPNPWQSDDATRAALAMRAALDDYNRELAAEGLPALGIGIGLHRGTGLAGWVGSQERMEYAFVGRTVNLAARVQALTREHGVDILLTEAVREKLDPRIELVPMPPARVKGIDAPIVTFSVRGMLEGAAAG
jgi:class 3 adenylate cyclase